MGLFPENDTVDVVFEDGSTVTLRKTITVGDQKFIQNRAMQGRLSMNGKPEENVFEFHSGEYQVALLERMIVAWSDERPLTPQNIEELPDEIATRLMAELNKHNVKRTEEEADPLGNGSKRSSGRRAIQRSAI